MQLRQRLLLLVPPGLEALAADEAAELAPGSEAAPAGSDLPGRLCVRAPDSLDWRSLRLATRVARSLGDVASGDVEELRRELERIDCPELDTAASFRVTSHAGPSATFDAQEAARAAGAVFHQRHGTPVDLRGFELEIRLDLGAGRSLVSVELHREPLDKRIRRPRPLRAALKPTVAAALLRLAGAHRGPGSLLDPTCGSGTIAVEAALTNPELSVHASDWDEDTVDLARDTLAAHELDVALKRADARELWPAWERRFDAVVFNPPHGVQVGKRARMDQLYRAILASVSEVLEREGRVVVLTPRRKALESAAREAGFVVEASLPVEMGGLRPRACLLRPA